MMKLYCTPTSPYARLARIVVLEKRLGDRVEIVWTRTRIPDDPMLAFNPSGRIPFLVLDDGSGLEDTPVIVDYLDDLAPPARFTHGADRSDWTYRQIEATARAMLDGLAVWAREMVRPESERSPTTLEHEKCRAARLAGHFEGLAGDARLTGALNMAQLCLFCALDVERRLPDFDWRTGHPNLVAWHARISDLPSVRGSLPPG